MVIIRILGLLNDLWRYDSDARVWAFVRGSKKAGQLGNYGSRGVESPTSEPGPREDVCADFDRGSLIVIMMYMCHNIVKGSFVFHL